MDGEPPYADVPQLKALFLITTQGLPPLKDIDAWSDDFLDFLSLCMQQEPDGRASAADLLKVFYLLFVLFYDYMCFLTTTNTLICFISTLS